MLYPNGLTTPPRVTGPYGWRINPVTHARQFHTGADSVGHPGGWNYASVSGVVIFAGYNGGAGNEVRVREDGTGNVVRIKHHARIDVRVGQRVGPRTITGPTGTTGQSTGVHCHFEVWPGGGFYTDPYPYVAAHLGSTAGGGVTPIENPATRSAAPQKGSAMSQVIYTEFDAPLADADPRVAKIKSYQGGETIKNFSKGVGLAALVGDAPGYKANVQVSQADKRINEWCADHTGAWRGDDGTFETDGNGVPYAVQAGRKYSLDAFLALCDAYLTPSGELATVEVGEVNIDLTPLIEAVTTSAARVEAAVKKLNPAD